MKQINKSHLLIMSSVALIVASLPFLNFSSSESSLDIGNVLNSISTGDRHVSRLYELILSTTDEGTGVKLNIDSSKNQLNISNGLVVGQDSSSDGALSSIGGGKKNTIKSSNYAGIAGGIDNTIENGHNSVIGGGRGNNIKGANAIIAGGESNQAGASGVVIGGKGNSASNNGVVLGGQNNSGDRNSLLMGSGARGKSAFARNGSAGEKSARIDAKSGVLIGTTEAIQGVSLVVNGAMKINGNNDNGEDGITGEIRVISGCFYAFDGKYWHIISQTNDSTICTGFVSTATCDFGNVRLQQGDQVTGYNATISKICDSERVVCSGGILLTVDGNLGGYDSPYCYQIDNS